MISSPAKTSQLFLLLCFMLAFHAQSIKTAILENKERKRRENFFKIKKRTEQKLTSPHGQSAIVNA